MACKTINPAIIALVDAMAGIMFPAIATNRFDQINLKKIHLKNVHFISNFDFNGIEKILERIFAAAVTKIKASSSS